MACPCSQAPNTPTEIEIEFEKGNPVAIDGVKMSPATLLTKLNKLGGDNGIGRIDLVESRFVGMKSRGVYETPGGSILLIAHRGIESITLDRGESHLKVRITPLISTEEKISICKKAFVRKPEHYQPQPLNTHEKGIA